MQVKIAISQGQVRLLAPIYLKPDAPSIYSIDVPDEMLAPSRDWFHQETKTQLQSNNTQTIKPDAKPRSLQERFNQILGKMAKVRQGTSIGEDHQLLMDALEDRYLGR